MRLARRSRNLLLVVATLPLWGCATRYEPPTATSGPHVRMQTSSIAPGRGGEMITAESLEPGDILLSSGSTLQSLGIQLATLAPVSHASVYLGEGRIAEAVGEGVRLTSVDVSMREEQMIVAFRQPQLGPAQADRIRAWSLSQVGAHYNFVGVLLDAPFVLSRRACEVPFVPDAVRDACVRGFAVIELSASSDDRFFCSQFVLEAYRQAGAPLTDADPRWVSPADLLHMRDGDVATIAPARPLRYVGHLKYTPPQATGQVEAR